MHPLPDTGDAHTFPNQTVTIDTVSESGSWARAIPYLSASSHPTEQEWRDSKLADLGRLSGIPSADIGGASQSFHGESVRP